MACVISSGLTLDLCNSNQGGLQTIYIQNYDSRTFTKGSGASASFITAISGATPSFYTFEIPTESSSITSTSTTDRTAGTTVHEQTAEMVIRGINTTTLSKINTLSQGIFRVVVKDNQGKYIMLGEEKGATFVANITSGTKYEDGSNGTLTATAREKNAPCEVDPTIFTTWIQA
jgi:hypothetical protein